MAAAGVFPVIVPRFGREEHRRKRVTKAIDDALMTAHLIPNLN
jgi:hypothetical protein